MLLICGVCLVRLQYGGKLRFLADVYTLYRHPPYHMYDVSCGPYDMYRYVVSIGFETCSLNIWCSVKRTPRYSGEIVLTFTGLACITYTMLYDTDRGVFFVFRGFENILFKNVYR